MRWEEEIPPAQSEYLCRGIFLDAWHPGLPLKIDPKNEGYTKKIRNELRGIQRRSEKIEGYTKKILAKVSPTRGTGDLSDNARKLVSLKGFRGYKPLYREGFRPLRGFLRGFLLQAMT